MARARSIVASAFQGLMGGFVAFLGAMGGKEREVFALPFLALGLLLIATAGLTVSRRVRSPAIAANLTMVGGWWWFSTLPESANGGAFIAAAIAFHLVLAAVQALPRAVKP